MLFRLERIWTDPLISALGAAGVRAALARIARTKAEALSRRGHESDAAPAEAAFVLALMPVPAAVRLDTAQLLSPAYDFRALLTAYAQGEARPLPKPRSCFLGVARAGYRVDCHHIEQRQYDWLVALADEHLHSRRWLRTMSCGFHPGCPKRCTAAWWLLRPRLSTGLGAGCRGMRLNWRAHVAANRRRRQ